MLRMPAMFEYINLFFLSRFETRYVGTGRGRKYESYSAMPVHESDSPGWCSQPARALKPDEIARVRDPLPEDVLTEKELIGSGIRKLVKATPYALCEWVGDAVPCDAARAGAPLSFISHDFISPLFCLNLCFLKLVCEGSSPPLVVTCRCAWPLHCSI